MKKSYIEKCYLYGAGLNAVGIIKFIGNDRVIGIIESNPDKIGKKLEGIEIINFQTFVNREEMYPIVISAYQRSEEIQEFLESNNYRNYLLSVYLQSNVTSVSEMVEGILENSKENELCLDNTNSLLSVLVIDELIKGNRISKLKGCLKADNLNVLKYYNLKNNVNKAMDDYLIVTTETSDDEVIFKDNTYNLCNFMYYNPKYSNEKLGKFRDIYKGKRCFVIGNGPSLRMDDLEKLKSQNEICFGSNGIYLAFNMTLWRPDFYVITDFERYRAMHEKIANFSQCAFFVRKFYNMGGLSYVKNAYIYNSPPQKNQYKFSGDITKSIYSGQTVTYNMLQIAAYMGFEKIYLLGVDFSFDNLTKSNHFSSSYEKQTGMKDIFYYKENLLAYEAAENYSYENSFRIFNATRGGELEVFERVNFDDIIKGE